ncbi:hypothetical protein [Rhizobium tumorigenes]|uniref:hypothetical protein n=1 Tax=Rhizobium tumorigenes TaxID=2041385 RepID=UPI00241E10CC|nr:hypothetical protein [Rhizobium tumorigenes]WFS02744.1 hypothetical protein PR016_09150 [Rhizobium tumorigenes]
MVNKVPTLAPAAARAIAAFEVADRARNRHEQEIAIDRLSNLEASASWVRAETAEDLLFQICALHSVLAMAESTDEGECISETAARAGRRLVVLLAQHVEATTGLDRSALGFNFMMDPRLDAKYFAGAV